MKKTAIIAGSGAEHLSPFRDWESILVPTRFGTAEIRQGEISGKPVLFVARHGKEHSTAPHLINYRAIISALSELEAVRVIGTAAVGSLSNSIPPGTAAVLTDIIDFTRRGPITFFDDPAAGVVHTDFSEPYCSEISAVLLAAAEARGLEVTTPCTYICTDGPRYETPAEISMFRSWGADVVGMTNAPEVILSREAGLCYGSIAIITNFAAGISPKPLSHSEVVECMKSIEEKLAAALIGAVQALPTSWPCNCGRTTSG